MISRESVPVKASLKANVRSLLPPTIFIAKLPTWPLRAMLDECDAQLACVGPKVAIGAATRLGDCFVRIVDEGDDAFRRSKEMSEWRAVGSPVSREA